jgi:hypothetical protein
MESDRTFGENRRQFDTTTAEGQRQFNLQRDDYRTAARQGQQAQIAGGLVDLAGKAVGSKLGQKALGKIGGAIAGKLGGAKAGAMLGSVVPGAGTLVGAGLGFLAPKIGGALKKLKFW